jgi:hypothetical protein
MEGFGSGTSSRRPSGGGTKGPVRVNLLLELVAKGDRLKHAFSFPDGELIIQEPGNTYARYRRV